MQQSFFIYCRGMLITGLMALFFVSAAHAQDSLNMRLVYHWNDTSIAQVCCGMPPAGTRFSEIWGAAVNGREYAIMGSSIGMHVFDITDPTTASEVVFKAGIGDFNFFKTHRDFKTYGQYLYEVAGGGDPIGLRIYDMQYLPDSMPVVYASDTLFDFAHNIFIDENKGRLYVCSGGMIDGGRFAMRVYSLAAPLDPQFEFELTGIDLAHDVYVRNDTAYVNAGRDGLWVVDYSGASPQGLGTLTSYPEQGFNHSGWLTDDGNTYVFADETRGTRLKIMDVSDIHDWSIVSLIGSGVDTFSIPHNQMIRGDLLFSSYYADGLRVFDISDPVNPLQVAWYDTYKYPSTGDFAGNWGVYCLLPSGRILASDRTSGLFVLELDNSILVGTENVEPHQLENVVVWPNPSSDLINLAIPLSHKTTLRIDLYTADRRWVIALMRNTSFEAGQQQFQFNLGKDLSAGTYFIEGYSSDQGSFIKPIVIH